MRRAIALGGALMACMTSGLSCQASPPAAAAQVQPLPARQVPQAEREVAEPIYQAGMRSGWLDFGWSARQLQEGQPAVVDMSNYGGWIVSKQGTQAHFGGVTFRVSVSGGAGRLALSLKRMGGGGNFPRVQLTADHVAEEREGWQRIWVSMEALNPEGLAFDELVLMGAQEGPLKDVRIDELGLTRLSPTRKAGGGRTPTGPARQVAMTVDCAAPVRPISPLIYGIAFEPMKLRQTHWKDMGATVRRWGGNTSSRYNWKLGNAWSTANDWYFRNVNFTDLADFTYERFLRDNAGAGMKTAVTVPMLGWVAKDTHSIGFPVSRFGAQQRVDPTTPEAGNGYAPDGTPLPPGPPTLTSVPAPPEFMAEWVSTLREASGGQRKVDIYILDNEPMIWSTTHRDVHPLPLSYDELLERTLAYGTAVRKADPGALIAGPAEWGWTNYFYSAVDVRAGVTLRPDRRAHGDVPLIPWYLRTLREHEAKTGERIIDLLDLHFYPQGAGMIEPGGGGRTDRESSARRIRATRSLWDPSYRDESWIDDTVRLIPRMQEWVRDNYPGVGTMLGEYNFGAEHHMSGGLAQAEALGRFGQQGLTAAFYYDYPPKGSPVSWAFRAYRNYDAQGGHFQELSVPTRAEGLTSLFASRNAEGTRLVLVALNHDPDRAARARIDLRACRTAGPLKVYRYTGQPEGLEAAGVPPLQGRTLEQELPPWSISVLEVELTPR